MEKRERVELISRHWNCSDKNVYKLMQNKDFDSKLKVIELGCICIENNLTSDELNLILKFVNEYRGLNGNR